MRLKALIILLCTIIWLPCYAGRFSDAARHVTHSLVGTKKTRFQQETEALVQERKKIEQEANAKGKRASGMIGLAASIIGGSWFSSLFANESESALLSASTSSASFSYKLPLIIIGCVGAGLTAWWLAKKTNYFGLPYILRYLSPERAELERREAQLRAQMLETEQVLVTELKRLEQQQAESTLNIQQLNDECAQLDQQLAGERSLRAQAELTNSQIEDQQFALVSELSKREQEIRRIEGELRQLRAERACTEERLRAALERPVDQQEEVRATFSNFIGAVKRADIGTMQTILRAYPQWAARRDTDRMLPIHYAFELFNHDQESGRALVGCLLQGSDVHAPLRANTQKTVFDGALATQDTEIVTLLKTANPDLNLHDAHPEFIALAANNQDILHLFIPTDNSEDGQCVICLDPLNDDKQLDALWCGHIFHQECIQRIRNQHDPCPICRMVPPAVAQLHSVDQGDGFELYQDYGAFVNESQESGFNSLFAAANAYLRGQ